ncbi:hypothetical protein QJS10_CPA10g01775 [Acorus calamus]|uniref:RNase H type-1 domain-containing protein n=1 Tax=Acorus calamus TaxID=4465 RepID=A0AAV9E223_ACOCL|nr:hypothetical protein QJS10_CPA10g01775 [Acorus calamus]
MVSNAFDVQIEEKELTSSIVKWLRSDDGWLKLNTDGSLADDRGGYGALIRNSNSDFQIGLAGRLDLPSINLLELKAIEKGVMLTSILATYQSMRGESLILPQQLWKEIEEALDNDNQELMEQ